MLKKSVRDILKAKTKKMIIKSFDKVAEPSTFLILLGVLKGYLNKPLFFLIKTKLTFKKFKKQIKHY